MLVVWVPDRWGSGADTLVEHLGPPMPGHRRDTVLDQLLSGTGPGSTVQQPAPFQRNRRHSPPCPEQSPGDSGHRVSIVSPPATALRRAISKCSGPESSAPRIADQAACKAATTQPLWALKSRGTPDSATPLM